ncbi:hypothetical protein PVAP13_3KG402311 [Panicum virgatum]|uniref:Uncharacterized protein n=1 Tax=Panicum virgatum TaxID=38727 RepID=A0A8T0UXK9_PANVG|nr:hypothetical protein PVAP13_3KG402311 [Panicum virgatum]
MTSPSIFVLACGRPWMLGFSILDDVGSTTGGSSRIWHGDAVPLQPIAHIPCPDLELPEPAQVPQQTISCATCIIGRSRTSHAVEVELDVALAVLGEDNDLLHPCPHQVVAVLGLLEVTEQGVHGLHLVPNEFHVAAEAAWQLCLVQEHRHQPAQ